MVFEAKETKTELTSRLNAEALATKKAEAITKVKEHFENLLKTGMEYKGLHIQFDSASQTDFSGLVTRSSSVSYPTSWYALENEYIEIETQEELETIADMLLVFKQDLHYKKVLARTAIEKATSEEEIEALLTSYLGV